MRWIRYVLVLAACGASVWAAFGLGACDDCTPATTFTQINNQILKRSCVFSVCHSKQGARDAGHLDLQTDPYKALLVDPVDNKVAKAQGLKRVVPGDPTRSFLIIKLNLPLDATADGGYQESMPQGNPHLPDCNLAGLNAWIIAGAPKD